MVGSRRVPPKGWRSASITRGTACLVLILLCVATWPATADGPRRRIYFLESLRPTQPAAMQTIKAFEERLVQKTTEQFEIFIDYMDLGRFPGEAHFERTARFLAGKYAQASPDVLIPLGRAAIPFMLKYRDAIAPHSPVIMASVTARDAIEAQTLANTQRWGLSANNLPPDTVVSFRESTI